MKIHKFDRTSKNKLKKRDKKNRPQWHVWGMVWLMAVVMLSGCGGSGGSGKPSGDGGQTMASSVEKPANHYDIRTGESKWVEMGNETFPSMLWGKYTYDEWVTSGETGDPEKPYSKYELDYDQFCEDVKFQKCSIKMEGLEGKTTSVELTTLPIEIVGAYPLGASKTFLESMKLKDKNPYQTLWGSYYWKIPINNNWELREWEEEIRSAFKGKFKTDDYWASFRNLMNQNVIQMEYLTKEKRPAAASFLYEVEGNKLHLYEWEADQETFEITKQEWGTIEFCFSGRNLMLRREGCTVTYCPAAFSQKTLRLDQTIPYTDGYVNDVNEAYQELLGFFWYGGDESKGSIAFTDNSRAKEETVCIDGDQLIFQWSKGEMTVGYLWTEPFGVVLVDDGKYYRYQHGENHYYEEQLGEFLDGDVSVTNLSGDQVDQLMADRNAILEELQKAFEQAEIHVEIDPNGGKVTMDSSILFGVDEDSVSEEGKDYLNRFLQVYGSVVTNEKYVDTISEIQVEGHTDTDGTYDHNLALSERRANCVMQYCLEVCPELEGRISAKGCAYDSPVYDADGNVDKAASRRVVFRFKLRVGEDS